MDEQATSRDNEYVGQMLVNEELTKKNINPRTASEDQFDAASEVADKRIKTMTDKEYASYDKEMDEEQAKADAEEVAAAKSAGSSGKNADSDSGSNGSLIGFAVILGLLFLAWLFLPVLIAMGLAYKVAANA